MILKIFVVISVVVLVNVKEGFGGETLYEADHVTTSSLESGDEFSCIVSETGKLESAPGLEVFTPITNRKTLAEATYFPAPKGSCMTFSVRTGGTPVISFNHDPWRVDPLLEFVLHNGTSTSFVRYNAAGATLPKIDTVGLISKDEYRTFWVKWTCGSYQLGIDGEAQPLLIYNSNDFNARYLGIYTVDDRGDWILHFDDCPYYVSAPSSFQNLKCTKSERITWTEQEYYNTPYHSGD